MTTDAAMEYLTKKGWSVQQLDHWYCRVVQDESESIRLSRKLTNVEEYHLFVNCSQTFPLAVIEAMRVLMEAEEA